jgi:hypothetical protein
MRASTLLLTILHASLCSYTLKPLTDIEEKGLTLSARPGMHPGNTLLLDIRPPNSLPVYYTLDGNLPGAERVSGPLKLSGPTTVTLRLGSASDTFYVGTYLVGFTSTLPVVSLTLPPGYLFDPASGIYLGGLRADGTRYGNCWKGMEKVTFFEFFDKDGWRLGQGCGLKVFGGYTKQNPEKSLRVIARKKYGPGKFKHAFFPAKDIGKFNSLVLRTSGNDYMHTRFLDMMCASLARDLGVDHLAYQPSVLFVNGEYWGIHNIREKVGADYLETNHDAPRDSTDIIFANGYLELGDKQRYDATMRFLANSDGRQPGFDDSLRRHIDIENYFKYIILQIHIVNVDSRGNVRMWRSDGVQEPFRFIFYDADLSFGHPRLDYLAKRLSPVETDWYNPTWATLPLRRSVESPRLREYFINTYCHLLATTLSHDSVSSRIRMFRSWLEPEIDRHLKRRFFNQPRRDWESYVQQLVDFSKTRSVTSFEYLAGAFGLKKRYTLVIPSADDSSGMKIRIEDHVVPSYPYTGRFFAEVPLRVSVSSLNPAYRFVSWSDGVKSPDRILADVGDTLVRITPIVQRVGASKSGGGLRMLAMGMGGDGGSPYLALEGKGGRSVMGGFWLLNERGDTLAAVTPEQGVKGIVFLARDTSYVRRMYPGRVLNLLPAPGLEGLPASTTLYLKDAAGDLIDSVNIRTGSMGLLQPHYMRDGERMAGFLSPPPIDDALKGAGTDGRTWALVLAAISAAGVLFAISRKRKWKSGY